MKHYTISLFVPLLLIFGCAGTKFPVVSLKADDFQGIIDKYYLAIDSIARIHSLRIGILPFASAIEQSIDSTNEFGRYITEKLTSRMVVKSTESKWCIYR